MTVPGLLRVTILFAAVQLAAYGIFYAGQMEEIDQGREQETQLKQKYATLKNRAVNLDLYKTQLEELEKLFGDSLVELPNKWLDPEFSELRRAARAHGLRVVRLQPEPTERLREYYAELKVHLEVSGPFHKIGAFVADLTTFPGSTLLAHFSVVRSPIVGVVTLKGDMRTFRYIADEERAELQKAAAAAERKAK